MPSTPNATAENGNRSNKQVNPTPLIRSQPTPSLSHLRRSPPSLSHCYSDSDSGSPTSQLSWSHPSQVLTFDSRLPDGYSNMGIIEHLLKCYAFV
nr:hypothetical protein Iba_chr13eCG10500 [Ipomoea batatas]